MKFTLLETINMMSTQRQAENKLIHCEKPLKTGRHPGDFANEASKHA